MDVDGFLNSILSGPDYAGQVVFRREEPALEARHADPASPLSPGGQRVLQARGIEKLYCHQAQAVDAVREGRDALIVTGTASGKSLCFQLSILEMLESDPDARALLLFPTKALCQDQFRSLSAAMEQAGLTDRLAGVYDSDTPPSLRRRLRDNANVILTNPDMLHAGLMPRHSNWARSIANLRIMVVDELHVYSGIFGSNMANVMRRFRRLCAHYGSDPRIIACSATIGNPLELANAIAGGPMELVDDDGSPRGKRNYVFWNPPRIRESIWRSRRSANVEAHELMSELIARGVGTITFSKARMTAEMIHRYTCDRLATIAPQQASKVTPYRGGYLPEERREIERKLAEGELIGVSSTRALELGIDVGCLDASIIVGYPGTLASFYQQSGRAGRGHQDTISVLVGLDTAINQFIMRNPGYIFDNPLEEAVLDPDNPYVIMGHLRCAACELPLPDDEVGLFGDKAELVLRVLQENLKLRHIRGKWYNAAKEIPHYEVSLRDYSDKNVLIQDVATGKVIGEVDKFDAPPILHPEAIYIHQGDTYRVLELDLDRAVAKVQREEVDYYTQPLGGTDVHHIDHQLREKPFGTGTAYWGEVTAYFRTWGYEKVRFYELDAISQHGLELPVFLLETMAMWVVPPEDLMGRVRVMGLDAHSGMRGIGYAARMVLPMFMTCDTLDFSHTIGCANSPWNAMFVYERYPHGLGFTEKAYDNLHEIMPAVLKTIRQCECRDGCPCCVGKPLRGYSTWNVERGEGSIPSKEAAIVILEGLIGDGSNLVNSDVGTVMESDEERQNRLEMSVRRRLERMREPMVFHDINPAIVTASPDVEDRDELPKPDVQRRHERRSDFNRELARRIAAKDAPAAPVQPSKTSASRALRKRLDEAQSTDNPSQPSSATPSPPQAVITTGDPLAARARRLKKNR